MKRIKQILLIIIVLFLMNFQVATVKLVLADTLESDEIEDVVIEYEENQVSQYSNYEISYAPYTGVDYSDSILNNDDVDNRRYIALQKAQRMATILWTAPVTFVTWCGSDGGYNPTTATDGTSSEQFVQGKTYQGIPYSMANHSADEVSWMSKMNIVGLTTSNMQCSYYSHGKLTTSYGSDCSYMVYLAMKEACSDYSFNYQTTSVMMTGGKYTQIGSCASVGQDEMTAKILPADVVISSGHTMLYVGRDGDNFAFFEATAEESKTRYKEYSYSQLSKYSFYRFNGFSDSKKINPDNEFDNDTRFNGLLPLKVYIVGNSNLNVLNLDLSTKIGTIYPTDECTIDNIYTNGWLKVTYPTSSQPKTGYVQIENFIPDFSQSLSQFTASARMDTYRKPDLTTGFGYVDANDVCYKVGIYGSAKQVIYPTGLGNKLGWMTDWPQIINNPSGCLDSVIGGEKTITVRGWVYDLDDLSTSIAVHVYVGGEAGSGSPCYVILANTYRPDVNVAYGCGEYHGFESTISVSEIGTQNIYVYAINVGSGNSNPLIGQSTVDISEKTPESVIEKFEITSQPVDYRGIVGDTASFSVGLTGSNLVYQWQYSNNKGASWYNSGQTGNETETLKVPVTVARNSQQYRCVIWDCTGNKLVSNAASIIVENMFDITSQPTNYIGKVGSIAEFKIIAEGTGLTYQWQYSNTKGASWYNSGQTGNETETLTVPVTATRDGQQYRCIVKDNAGNKLISKAALIMVESTFYVTSQPLDYIGKVGSAAKFEVVAQGDGLMYQWQYSNNGGVNWYNSGQAGCKTNRISVPITEKRDGQQYRCQIKNISGRVINSKAAVIHVVE